MQTLITKDKTVSFMARQMPSRKVMGIRPLVSTRALAEISNLASHFESLKDSDQPLPPTVRDYMEPRFGHDFSRVRVHSTGPGMIQTKLKINKPGDPYEQEVNRVADAVMRMPVNAAVSEQVSAIRTNSASFMQRQKIEKTLDEEEPEELTPISESVPTRDAGELGEGEEEELIQPKSNTGAAPQVTPGVAQDIHSFKGTGQPLPASERAFFEPRFGADFGNVRMHTDDRAARTAQAINARAFTLGRDVVFSAGQFSQGTHSGRRLIAHELAHVVQQSRFGTNMRPLKHVQRYNGGSGARAYQLKSYRFLGDRSDVLKKIAQGKATLSSGARGGAVKILKDALLDAGYPLPKHRARRGSNTRTSFLANTTFDAETARAVRMFQRVSRIRVNGVVDAATLKEMDPQIGNTPYNFAAELKRVAMQLTKNVREATLKGIETFPRTEKDWFYDKNYWKQLDSSVAGKLVPAVPRGRTTSSPSTSMISVVNRADKFTFDCALFSEAVIMAAFVKTFNSILTSINLGGIGSKRFDVLFQGKKFVFKQKNSGEEALKRNEISRKQRGFHRAWTSAPVGTKVVWHNPKGRGDYINEWGVKVFSHTSDAKKDRYVAHPITTTRSVANMMNQENIPVRKKPKPQHVRRAMSFRTDRTEGFIKWMLAKIAVYAQNPRVKRMSWLQQKPIIRAMYKHVRREKLVLPPIMK